MVKKGFKPHEIIRINQPDLAKAFFELGRKTKPATGRILRFEKKKKNYPRIKQFAQGSLAQLRKLATEKKKLFTLADGVNHLENYLTAFDNFCNGTGIKSAEGALLQITDQFGCQTMMVRNTKSQEIAAIHTEEDDEEYRRSKNPAYGKHWVEMKIGERRISFYAWAGICSWGATTALVDNHFFQAADVLMPQFRGNLWANAVVFMILDCADFRLISELVRNLKRLPRPRFLEGETIHMIEGVEPPQMRTIEFGGNEIEFLKPIKSNGTSVLYGTNYPHLLALRKIDYYAQGRGAKGRREMLTRLRHMQKLGVNLHKNLPRRLWGKTNVQKYLSQVLKTPQFSNDLVAHNDIVYITPEGKIDLTVQRSIKKTRSKRS